MLSSLSNAIGKFLLFNQRVEQRIDYKLKHNGATFESKILRNTNKTFTLLGTWHTVGKIEYNRK